MSIIEKINAPGQKLSKSDQRLLEYIRKNGLNACSAAISEIAKSCDVSHATVTRFARKFGYDSLRSFKIDLAKEIGSDEHQGGLLSSTISKEECCEETAHKLLQINLATLKQTFKDIDYKVVDDVAKALIKANRVFFFGMGNSGFAALDSAYKFTRIGIDSRAITDGHDIQIHASLIKPNDILIAFSNSGSTKEIIHAARIGIKNNAKVVAITSQGSSNLAEIASVSITYAIRESIIESGSINSKLAIFYIVDLLFAEVVKILGNKAVEMKQKTVMALNL